MCVCVRVCGYVGVGVDVITHVCVYMYIHVCTNVCMCVNLNIYINVCMYE
jgi:hypothetical protein